MSTNNPQYENSIEGNKGEIVVAGCGISIQISELIDQLGKVVEDQRLNQRVYIG